MILNYHCPRVLATLVMQVFIVGSTAGVVLDATTALIIIAVVVTSVVVVGGGGSSSSSSSSNVFIAFLTVLIFLQPLLIQLLCILSVPIPPNPQLHHLP